MTAPLPALVAVAGVGAIIVLYRVAILDWCRAALGTGVGPIIGRVFVVVGGYGWLLIGLAGIVFWIFDEF